MRKIHALGTKIAILVLGSIVTLFSKAVQAQMTYAPPDVMRRGKVADEQITGRFELAWPKGYSTVTVPKACQANELPSVIVLRNIPAGTKSLVVLLTEQAPVLYHAVVYNIPPEKTTISSPQDGVPIHVQYGSSNRLCSGERRYTIEVIALDTMLDLPQGGDQLARLFELMQGHQLGKFETKVDYVFKEAEPENDLPVEGKIRFK